MAPPSAASSPTRVGMPTSGDLLEGKYRIEKLLGEGGMGVVLAARHELLDQRVAVKVLFPETARDTEAQSRFLLEARSTARINSEHVARVMDVGTLPSGLPFIVMELLEGCDLDELLKLNGPLPVQETVDYVLQALEGIAQAHALGIVHRDLKPANLFLATLPNGSAIIKILDFGISKSIASRGSGKTGILTREHTSLGSPAYMSPEQVRNAKNVDPRTDVWSLGAAMYELLSGRVPFAGGALGEIFAKILEEDPEPLAATRPDCPPGLADAIMRCLERDREKRFSNVVDLARAIAPYGSPSSVVMVDRIEQTLRRTGTRVATPAIAMRPKLPSTPDAVTMAEAELAAPPAPPSTPAHVTGLVAFTTDSHEDTEITDRSARRRTRKRVVLAAVLGALAACGVFVAVSVTRGTSDAPKAASASPVSSTQVVSAAALPPAVAPPPVDPPPAASPPAPTAAPPPTTTVASTAKPARAAAPRPAPKKPDAKSILSSPD